MDKRSYFLNNSTKNGIRIAELGIILPPGVSNLFELNSELSFEQIDYSLRRGTLRTAMEQYLCQIVPDVVTKSISSDVVVRNPHQIQVFQNRAKFQVAQMDEANVFDPIDDFGLFENDEVVPARQLEEELKKAAENIQTIEATVKDAKLPEKPIDNKYTQATQSALKSIELQEKIRNDVTMGYETCSGFTSSGKKCLRRAKTGKGYCGLHIKQK